jgi:hypothetical protein
MQVRSLSHFVIRPVCVQLGDQLAQESRAHAVARVAAQLVDDALMTHEHALIRRCRSGACSVG